jgi:hypothetical protein
MHGQQMIAVTGTLIAIMVVYTLIEKWFCCKHDWDCPNPAPMGHDISGNLYVCKKCGDKQLRVE